MKIFRSPQTFILTATFDPQIPELFNSSFLEDTFLTPFIGEEWVFTLPKTQFQNSLFWTRMESP
jgi:hypothetical protein